MDAPLRALLIQDCQDDAALVLRELKRGQFAVESRRVQTAADLNAALDAQEWDVVVSDYAMPQLSGLDALATIREKCPDLPFILVCGAIGEAVAVTAMKAGANDYVLKDSLARLAPVVTRVIQESRCNRSARDELWRAQEQLEIRIQERTAALAEANAKLVTEIAERKQIANALQESEQRLNLALQASRTGIWAWDIVSNRVTWDATTHTIFGVPPDSFGGTFEDFVRSIHPEDRASVEQSVKRALSHGVVYESSFRIIDPEGNIRFITATGRAIRDECRKPIRMTGVCLDTTERERARDELMLAKAAAESANRAKSEFLANMSHEIRTPMTAIMGHADMLMDDALSQKDRLDAVHTIRRQSEHLLTIINDILDLSKIEAGKMEIEQIDCDPSQIASDVASLMRVRAIERGIKLELQFQGRVPQTIRTDPTRVRQVLMNLVGNAIKFTNSGGVQIVVSLGQGVASNQAFCDSPSCEIAPVTKVECHTATRQENPPIPDGAIFRAEIRSLTAVLGRLSAAEERELTKPLIQATTTRVWLMSARTYSSFNPVSALLSTVARVTVSDRLPDVQEAEGVEAIVLLTPTTADLANLQEFKKLVPACPILWMAGETNGPIPRSTAVQPIPYPTPIKTVSEFVSSVAVPIAA
jgi:PAS domain S-box-containing protein